MNGFSPQRAESEWRTVQGVSKSKVCPIRRVQSQGCLCPVSRLSHVKTEIKTSLVIQWLRLRAPSAGGLGSIPGQGTRLHMLQLGSCAAKYIIILFFLM